WVRIVKQAPDHGADHSGTSGHAAKKASSARKPKKGSSSDGKKLVEMDYNDLQTVAQSGVEVQAEVAVHAMLCWSERYNGTWQAPKTSDVDAPMILGHFPHNGPRAFKRSSLRLRTAPLSGGRLMVDVSVEGTPAEEASGFILYNTHSVPV